MDIEMCGKRLYYGIIKLVNDGTPDTIRKTALEKILS